MTSALTRRSALLALTSGISLVTFGDSTLAGTDPVAGRRKLVVIICRGGIDGLALSPPVGDPGYAGLRQQIAFGREQVLALDGTFGLNPALASIHKLARSGQARIVPAIATPDRARSHFEAQDVLESGASVVFGTNSGWLNRALEVMGPGTRVPAMSVGATAPLLLRGKIQTASWSPGREIDTGDRVPQILMDLYAEDPLLGPALASGLQINDMADHTRSGGGAMAGSASGTPAQAKSRGMGQRVAAFMTQDGGPRIVGLSVEGFDTHANQGTISGNLSTRLGGLDALIDGIQTGLGPAWKDTVIVVATEFGRTARVNGTGGTDHGTASTALVLGGSLKAGGIIGDWPTLRDAALFQNRDLAPTLDMRSLFKSILGTQMGVDRRSLDTTVFPDSINAPPIADLV
jgi:uncharacterized protein (DUF1501 family)